MNFETMTRPVAAADAFQFNAVVIGLGFLAEGRLAVALGDGSVRLICAGGSDQPLTVRPHTAQAALLAAAVDVDGMGLLTGGDDGRLVRTDSDGATSLLAEFPDQQLDVIAANAASGLRGVAAGREIRLIDRTARRLDRRRIIRALSPVLPSIQRASASPQHTMAASVCGGRPRSAAMFDVWTTRARTSP